MCGVFELCEKRVVACLSTAVQNGNTVQQLNSTGNNPKWSELGNGSKPAFAHPFAVSYAYGNSNTYPHGQ